MKFPMAPESMKADMVVVKGGDVVCRLGVVWA